MPRGTVRALITIMIVAFPFWYLMIGDPIPGILINSIFIVVAFYFEARRTGTEKLKEIVNEIKSHELVEEILITDKKPLYLPKYTVRLSLVVMLFLQIVIIIQQDSPYAATNTLADILLMITLFIIGSFFRSIMKLREKKSIREQIQDMDASLSDAEIIEKLMLKELSWLKKEGKNLLSLIVLIGIVISLVFFTIDLDFIILDIPLYTLRLQGILLLLINLYYGFRD